MESINILLIFWAAIVLIPVFMFLPYISKQKEPFGFKTKEPLDDSQFYIIRNSYYKSILLFSIPFTAIVIILFLLIQNSSFKPLLLGLLILGLVCINLIFYMQAYAKVKAYLNSKKESVKLNEEVRDGKNKIETW